MDELFKYLKDEQALVVSELKDLVQNFSGKNREEVFDKVKVVCDRLRGYLKKQSVLLFDESKEEKSSAEPLQKVKSAQDKLFDDLESLVMVHVDEPGFQSYLANLLQDAEQCFLVSQEAWGKLAATLSKPTQDKIDEKFKQMIHSDVGFNSIQPAAEPAEAAKKS